jgi:hypothetical protein
VSVVTSEVAQCRRMASPAGKPNATESKTVTDTLVGRLHFWLSRCVSSEGTLVARTHCHVALLPWCSLAGEHTHTIVGYSLIKGIGDGEPIASERFTVGGHEWVSTDEGPAAVKGLQACQAQRCRAVM